MAAGIVVPISGPYTATYHTFPLGTQNDDGYVLNGTYQGQEVNLSDAFGMTLVEAIYRGLNWRLRFRGLEFNRAGLLHAMQVFGSVGNSTTTFSPNLGFIGDRYSKYSKTLILTSILAGVMQAPPSFVTTLTAESAVVAPQSNVEHLYTSKVREAPMEMVLLPYRVSPGISSIPVSFITT